MNNEEEYKYCRACGGDGGHYEGCHGEAALLIKISELESQLQAEKERAEAYEKVAIRFFYNGNDEQSCNPEFSRRIIRTEVNRILSEKKK